MKAYFLFVITKSKKICGMERSLNFCGTIHIAMTSHLHVHVVWAQLYNQYAQLINYTDIQTNVSAWSQTTTHHCSENYRNRWNIK